MKTLIAMAFLLVVVSFSSAHAEWEMLDPGTAVGINAQTSPTATSISATSVVKAAQRRNASQAK